MTIRQAPWLACDGCGIWFPGDPDHSAASLRAEAKEFRSWGKYGIRDLCAECAVIYG